MNSKNKDLDDPNTTVERIKIIEKKKYLKYLYNDFYAIFKKESKKLPSCKLLELGSGAGFLKKIIPEVITSDVMKLPNCDMVVSAEKMPFKNNTLSAIYMLNVFHHIKNSKKALSEFQRCLKKGGKVIMIEPHNSPWSKFINKNFHHEGFDPSGGWKIKDEGELSAANGALPWIIFIRDRKEFSRLFPNFKIQNYKPHTPLSYLFSGGFKAPSIIPGIIFPIIRRIENEFSYINDKFGMFTTIVIVKT